MQLSVWHHTHSDNKCILLLQALSPTSRAVKTMVVVNTSVFQHQPGFVADVMKASFYKTRHHTVPWQWVCVFVSLLTRLQ